MKTLFFIVQMLLVSAVYAEDVRIKDLANVRGNRSNQLLGFGLVVGLSGTGDSAKSMAKNKAASHLLTRLGVKAAPEDMGAQSAASVIVTADLPAFARNGDRIDVKVSTVGDAKSLAGGTLVMTPLRAGDNMIYAVAQGAVVVGQAKGSGASVQTVATIPGGATVEKEFSPLIAAGGKIILSLRNPDFTTSTKVAEGINQHFRGFFATANDPVSISVNVPPLFHGKVAEFIAEVEGIRVAADQRAVVVINERTGTVVMGADVSISQISIAHGALSIQVGGETAKSKDSSSNESLVNIKGATVGQLVTSLNTLGVKSADLVGIIQAIHAAGALRAELKFM